MDFPLTALAGAPCFAVLAVALSLIGLAIVPVMNHTPKPIPETLASSSVFTRLLLAYGNVVLMAVSHPGAITCTAGSLVASDTCATPPYPDLQSPASNLLPPASCLQPS
jgi:hypothetical protein